MLELDVIFESLVTDEEEFIVELEEEKGVTHPVKINAKKGMANPMNRKAFSLCIQSILSFMIQKERCFLMRCKIATSLTILRY